MKSWSLTFVTQMLFRRSGSEIFESFKNIILLRIFPLLNIYSWKMLRKLKWQILGEPLAARYNWCQGPVSDHGPAFEKHWYRGQTSGLKNRRLQIQGYSYVPPGFSDPCGTVAGMVTPKGSMSTEGETLQVSVLLYRCSICWLLRAPDKHLSHARQSRPMAPAGLFVSQRTGSHSARILCTTHELFCP